MRIDVAQRCAGRRFTRRVDPLARGRVPASRHRAAGTRRAERDVEIAEGERQR